MQVRFSSENSEKLLLGSLLKRKVYSPFKKPVITFPWGSSEGTFTFFIGVLSPKIS